jgi:hypothetical protein
MHIFAFAYALFFRHPALVCLYTIAAVGRAEIGDAKGIADHVRYLGCRVDDQKLPFSTPRKCA